MLLIRNNLYDQLGINPRFIRLVTTNVEKLEN